MFDMSINSAWIQSEQKGQKIQQFAKELVKPQKYNYQKFIKMLDGIISSDLTKSVTEAILTKEPSIPAGCKQLKQQMIKLSQNIMFYIIQSANMSRRTTRKKRYHQQQQSNLLLVWLDASTISIKKTSKMDFLNNKTAEQIWLVYDAAYHIVQSVGYGRIMSIILQNASIIPLNPCTFLFLLINFFLKMNQIIKAEKYDIQLYSAPLFSTVSNNNLSILTDQFKNQIAIPTSGLKKKKFDTPKQLFNDLSNNLEVKQINKQSIKLQYQSINKRVQRADTQIQQNHNIMIAKQKQIQKSNMTEQDKETTQYHEKIFSQFYKISENNKSSLVKIYNDAQVVQQKVMSIVNPISINIKPSMNQKDKFISAAVKYLQIFNSKVIYQQQVTLGMLQNMPLDISLQMLYLQQKRLITGVQLSVMVKQTIFKVQQFRQSPTKISQLQKQFNQFVDIINNKLQQFLVSSVQRIKILVLKGQRISKQYKRIKSIQTSSQNTTKNLSILQQMTSQIYQQNNTILKVVSYGFQSTNNTLESIKTSLNQSKVGISNLQSRVQNSIIAKFDGLSNRIANQFNKSQTTFNAVLGNLQALISFRFNRIENAIDILYNQTQNILTEINKLFNEIKKISQRLTSIQFFVEKNYQQTNKIQQQLLAIANLVSNNKQPKSIQNLIQLVQSLNNIKQLEFNKANTSLESMTQKINGIKLPNTSSLHNQLQSMTSKINGIKLPSFNQFNTQLQSMLDRVNNLKPQFDTEPIYNSMSAVINRLQEQSNSQQQKYKQFNQKVRNDAKTTLQGIFQRFKDDPALLSVKSQVKDIGSKLKQINVVGLQSQVDRILKSAKLRSTNMQKQFQGQLQKWKNQQDISSQQLKRINQTVITPIRQILQSDDISKFKKISKQYKQLVPMIQTLLKFAQSGGGGKQPDKNFGLQIQSIVSRIQKSIEAMKSQHASADQILKKHYKQKQQLNSIIAALKQKLASSGRNSSEQNEISSKLNAFQLKLTDIEDHMKDMVLIKKQNSQKIEFGQNTKFILKKTINMFLKVIKQKSQFIDKFIKNMVQQQQIKDPQYIQGVGDQLKNAEMTIFKYIKKNIGDFKDQQMNNSVIKNKYKSFDWWDTSNKRVKN